MYSGKLPKSKIHPIPLFIFEGGEGGGWEFWPTYKIKSPSNSRTFHLGGGGGVLYSGQFQKSKIHKIPQLSFSHFQGGGAFWVTSEIKSPSNSTTFYLLGGGGGVVFWTTSETKKSIQFHNFHFLIFRRMGVFWETLEIKNPSHSTSSHFAGVGGIPGNFSNQVHPIPQYFIFRGMEGILSNSNMKFFTNFWATQI